MTKISYLSLFHAHFLVKPQRNNAPYWNKALKLSGAIILLLLFLAPASFAQNTKGDKPQTSSGAKRENRFKSTKQKKVKGKKSYNRAQANKSSKAGRAQSSQPTKIYSQKGPFVNKGSNTSKIQKRNLKSSTSQSRVAARSSSSHTRNVYPQRGPFVNNASPVPQSKPPKFTSNKSTVKRIRSQNKSISSRNVYPQRGPYVNNPSKVPKDKPRLANTYPPGYRRVKTPPKDSQQKWSANTTPHNGVRSVSGKTKKVYSQKGPYVHNPSQKSQRPQRTVSNQSQVAKVSAGASRAAIPGKEKKRKGAISASRPYISRKSINAFAGFWNKKPKGEKPYTSGDLAGHKLRSKNYQTKMPVIVNPTAHPYEPKKSVGDRPYSGPIKGGYRSATQSGRAWSGDIAGRKIRGRNLSSKKTVQPGRPVFPPKKAKQKIGDTPYKGSGGGYRTFKIDKRPTGPLPGKTPGGVANKIDSYQGTIRGSRKPISARGVGYSGNLKSRKPLKGGGSSGGLSWNNGQQPLDGTPPLRRNIGYALFSGNKKTRVTPKGGGSVSGKMWNNKNAPLTGKTPSSTSIQMGAFSGNTKAQRPLKGGGSVSGRMWNNKEQPILGKIPGKNATGMDTFQGTFKAVKKPKGAGGSISGRLWNNNESPIIGKAPRGQAGVDTYQGNLRVSKKEPSRAVGGTSPKKYIDPTPPMQNQGEEFTGFIKLKRLPRHYIKGPNSAQTALKKARPEKGTYEANGLQVRVKQQKYGTKPKAAEGALKGIVASKSSIKASEYSKVLRLKYDYIHNPSSSKDALKTREPGKAFARESDYQGNIKMKKFDLFGKKDLHPDAQFVKTNKNNVESERSLLTNFKLTLAKLFGKDDLQPDSVKEKQKKPKYNKDEGQIWYNQHNSSPGRSNSLRNAKTPEDN